MCKFREYIAYYQKHTLPIRALSVKEAHDKALFTFRTKRIMPIGAPDHDVYVLLANPRKAH